MTQCGRLKRVALDSAGGPAVSDIVDQVYPRAVGLIIGQANSQDIGNTVI